VGQGYRLYDTKQVRTVILLLCGGTKKTQTAAIATAQAMAAALNPAEHKKRKRK